MFFHFQVVFLKIQDVFCNPTVKYIYLLDPLNFFVYSSLLTNDTYAVRLCVRMCFLLFINFMGCPLHY